jgi:hypothetical protein
MKLNIVIVGGGISGLIAAHTFKQHDYRHRCNICVLEHNKIGGEFIAGGLKYIHRTDAMIRLFNKMHIPYSNYTVRGGIMLRGQVLPYPRCFEGMAAEERTRIRQDHYVKTRKTASGPWSERSMNDPASVKPRKALRCDFKELIQKLAKNADVVGEKFIRLGKDFVSLSNQRKIPYDFLVFTIPLWAIRGNVPFYVPHGVAMKLNIATIMPAKDAYAKWDYVYTPYTPANYIHRFSPHSSGYVVEANGELDSVRLESDLGFIFPDGYYVERVRPGLKGHLIQLQQPPEWPTNVAPLGRFAQWNPRATADAALASAQELAIKWIG